jgi:DNA-binding CsgD family transcriptional regulator/tetratricopeptide (TPR) repeat protein
VGRDDVLARLEALVEESAISHEPVTVLVEGPAGIGKTRVLVELAARLGDRADVLFGHCVALGDQTLPFAPLVDALGELIRREGATAVRRWAGPAADELGRLAPGLTGDAAPTDSTASSSTRLYQALTTLFRALAERRPLVLVLEDMHWADRSTRELIALLARQQHSDLVIVVSVRTDESPVPPGLAGYLADLVRHSEHRVVIGPLTRDEQARQVSDILGVPPRTQLLNEIYARAEGNPFFAEELLALGADNQLPTTVRDLLLTRLESLQPATRQVLRTACLVGREVPFRLLEAVVDVRGERLEAALREAVEAHVLHADGDALVFRHALLQEAIAASLLPGEAARAHRRLAETLTEAPTLAGRRYGGVAGRIARHWDAADEPERALVASLAAGREASTALAFAESLAHYQRALELGRVVPDGERLLDVPRARLLRSIAEVAHLAAHPDVATALIREAIDCVDPADEHLRGWLHERLGRYLWMSGDGQGALVAYQEAVHLVPAEPPTRARAAVLSGLSQILMLADRHAESAQRAYEAIAVARQLPDGRSIEGHARCNLGVDLAALGRIEEGIAELRTAIRIADEEFDDVDENARAVVNLGSVLWTAGRLREAADVALESVRVSDELGLHRRKGVWCRCDAAHVLALLGRTDEAWPLLEEARELAPQGVDAIRVDLVEGFVRSRQGDLENGRRLLERARAAGGQLLDPQLLGPLYAALAETALAQGDVVGATAIVDEALGLAPDTWHPVFAVPVFTVGVAVAVRHNPPRAERARDLLRRAEVAEATLDWSPSMVEAELAGARAELSDDSESWAAVAEHWNTLGDRYRAAAARVRCANAVLTAGGDRHAAAGLLDSAVVEGRAIGAAGLVALAEDLGRRSRLRLVAAASAGNPHRLTSRESDVLGLVCQGLTDRQIGAALFISPRTAERHVSNLLAKLAVERRSELVAAAHRERLLNA